MLPTSKPVLCKGLTSSFEFPLTHLIKVLKIRYNLTGAELQSDNFAEQLIFISQ